MTQRDTRRHSLEVRIQRLEAELAQLENLPDEPPTGSVVRFTKWFGGATFYQFAALRAQTSSNASWFVTGTSAERRPMTWDELLDFVATREANMPEIQIVKPNGWKVLV